MEKSADDAASGVTFASICTIVGTEQEEPPCRSIPIFWRRSILVM